MIRYLYILLFLASSCLAMASDYTARYTTETLTLDGILDEDPWKRADVLEFHVPVTNTETTTKAIGRLCWDDNYVYVAIDAEDRQLVATRTGRDGEVYRDDVLEFFFQPGPEGTPYYNVEVNAAGAFYDGLKGMSARWNFQNIKIGIQLDGTLNDDSDTDRGWTLEMAIPLAELDVRAGRLPTIGEEWRYHLSRYDYDASYDSGKELSSTARLSRVSFHHVADWDTLQFE